jgi:ComF family protein
MIREIPLPIAGKILVPVPLHWRRRWKRGYNQSELLAQILAREYGCPVIPLLRRCRPTRQQVGLNRKQRQHNVEGVFSLDGRRMGKKKVAADGEIFLVDDVFTTGSTLHACAKVLAENGFPCVHALTLAHG